MNAPKNARHSGARLAVRRLFDAIDRALAAAREVEQARADLDRETSRTVRLHTEEPEKGASRA
jgi:hypothetical protein